MIRIVKMTFQEDAIADFIRIFEASKPRILNFQGCSSVMLIQDKSNPSLMMTYSIWDSEDALNAYRESNFFKETWTKTKLLFNSKPEAWSLDQIG